MHTFYFQNRDPKKRSDFREETSKATVGIETKHRLLGMTQTYRTAV